MSVRRELIKLIAFAVVALAVLWVLWSTLLNTTSGDTKSYTADFTDVSGLHTGDNVRIAGVRVGRVDDMELIGKIARVTLTIRADQPIFENTRVLIRYQNLVGQRYVSMVAGDGPAKPLADGARIPVDRTEPSFDLSALFNGFQPLFSVLQPADVNKLSENIVQVLQGSGPQIPQLLAQINELTNKIADRDQIIGSVITNLNQVLANLNGKTPEFESLLDQTQRLVGGLDANTTRIFGSLEKVREFTGNANDLVRDIRPDVRTDVDRAVDVTNLLLDHKPVIQGTLDAFPDFLSALARISQQGAWLNLYACGINIQVAPGFPGFGTLPSDTHTEVCR
ncbi:MCE family protein [Pseudonocardia spinosispora]|uniref:MCE family protein n=1 Tax=Pseudonocardia spinosispora TaxID=103441 RepID=UPI00041DBEDF|nr:MlaD family protein [Pseudonocardia spinosispora]